MKINLRGYVKNLNTGEKTKINTSGIKTENKITYKLEEDHYTVYLKSKTLLILKRENENLLSTLYFELNKVVPSSYIVKKEDIDLLINIKTNSIFVSDRVIEIDYLVVDSDTRYKYKIEMSDKYEYKKHD